MNVRSSSNRSGCVSLEVWGGWLATIASAILGAVLAAYLSGREIAGLRDELTTKQLKIEEQAKQLVAATEYGRIQTEALTAARMELQQLRDTIRRRQVGDGRIADSSAVTVRCSARESQLPDPFFSHDDSANVVTVFVAPNGCWSEFLKPPIGYRYWALRSSSDIELGISVNMSVPSVMRPSGMAGEIGNLITPRAIESGKRVEFGGRLLGYNVPETIRLRNRGRQMAMITLILQPE